jgi:hydrogenase expression/formation protein HypD
MKYIDEYRDSDLVRKQIKQIHEITTKPWAIMEVCGGQTHTIVKTGIDEMLPDLITLIHGPGCPVCVTPLSMIDKALAIASRTNVIFTSFGDMLRVPGSAMDLFRVRAEGGDVRIVYSPLDAVKLAQKNPDKQVVFFAVGFETTAPANAMAVWHARELGLTNFSVLVSHVLVPPAMTAILDSPFNSVRGFIAAGHVCAVMGYEEYEPMAELYKVPIVVTGFEPLDLLQGIYMVVKQLEEGRNEVENQYTRAVAREGNIPAKSLIAKVFRIGDRAWRGIGIVPDSGYILRDEFSAYDAESVFSDISAIDPKESERCISGLVLQGIKKPHECSAFGKECTPMTPLGATMVSSEGACAAYYNYGRFRV